MNFSFRPHGIVIEPPSAVELMVSVDDRVIRVVIDWATLGRLVATEIRDSRDVEDFVDTHRRALALVIKARLFARGVPLARELVLSFDDLQLLHTPEGVADWKRTHPKTDVPHRGVGNARSEAASRHTAMDRVAASTDAQRRR